MNTQIVRIQTKGLVTIPKKMRDKLGFEENGLARIKREKDRVVIEPVRTLSYPVRAYTANEVENFINEDKKETKKLKVQKLL